MNNLVTRPDIHARSSKNGIIELIKSSKHDIIMRHYRMTVSSTRLCGKDLALDSQTDDALRPYFSMLS